MNFFCQTIKHTTMLWKWRNNLGQRQTPKLQLHFVCLKIFFRMKLFRVLNSINTCSEIWIHFYLGAEQFYGSRSSNSATGLLYNYKNKEMRYNGRIKLMQLSNTRRHLCHSMGSNMWSQMHKLQKRLLSDKPSTYVDVLDLHYLLS